MAITHTQAVASDTWTIQHTFKRHPSVIVIVGGELVEPDVYYPSVGAVVIEFAEPTVGTAVLA